MRISLLRSSLLISLMVTLSLSTQAKFGLDEGMSGGGGYVIAPQAPDHQMSPDYVEHIIERGGQESLKSYLILKKEKLQAGKLPGAEISTIEKLFSSPIFEAVDRARIIINENDSCYGANGEPTDGSFYIKKKHAICISAKNISQKVHRSEIKPQTYALMVHEYSESMGFTEQEAKEIQKIVLDDLKNETK